MTRPVMDESCADADGKVAAIVEHKDATPEQRAIREINTGIMAAPTAAFARWLPRIGNRNAGGEYYLTDVIALAVADGIPVETTHPASADETLGINSKRDSGAARADLSTRAGRRAARCRVTLADPARIDVRGTLACGRDVTIDVGCIFEGEVLLGDAVSVGAHSILRDVKIGTATAIAPYSHIDGADIRARCRIGPYARIRPGTRLADEVHIGNFVEVKAQRCRRAQRRRTTWPTSATRRSGATSTSVRARSPATTTARTSIGR